MALTKVNLDFSETQSRGGKKSSGGRAHYEPGDYSVKVKNATIIKSSEKQTPGILLELIITGGKHKGSPLSDRLWLTEKSLWKVRQAMEAMGIRVPSKKVAIDVTKWKGKELAVTVEDEEYDDKVYSRIVDFFLLTELDDEDDVSESDDEEDDEDDEDDDNDDEDDEEDEDEEEESSDDDLEGLDLDDL